MESMTPGMRYTPPNMAVRGMRMMANREAIGAYRINESVRRENERGNSLCILPTPLLRHQEVLSDMMNVSSPIFLPSKPSPVISAFASPSPTPVGPDVKKQRAQFPMPRLSNVEMRSARRRSSEPSNPDRF